eukprot:7810111-Prorocentrum_lima.AAC.1
MTSSLVGSEMCIRDRPSHLRTLLTRSRAPPVRMSEQACSGGPQQAPHPVSYTHLTLPTICSV